MMEFNQLIDGLLVLKRLRPVVCDISGDHVVVVTQKATSHQQLMLLVACGWKRDVDIASDGTITTTRWEFGHG
jgi:hypothetical protein